ncbi:MAG: sensor histidine kinase [Clostridiales bacterium]|nr:sensor histidine kinase [Clostridiales bacterium]
MQRFRQWIRRFYNPGSVRTSILLSFMAIIILVVFLLSLLSYRHTMQDSRRTAISYTDRLLSEITYSIDAYIGNMKSTADLVGRNSDVRSLLSLYQTRAETGEADETEIRRLRERVAALMETAASTRSDITNIAVVSRSGEVVLSDRTKQVNPYADFMVTDWYLRPLSYTKDIIVSPSHVQNLVQGEYPWVISISKAITDPLTEAVTGVLVVDLNYSAIAGICENAQIGSGGYIYLIDNRGNLIYHKQQQLIHANLKSEYIHEVLAVREHDEAYLLREDDRSVYLLDYSSLTDWTAVGVVKTEELIDKHGMIVFFALMAISAVSLAAVMAALISTAITRPIKQLESTMHEVEQGDLSVRADTSLNNEIGHLSRAFNSMVEHTNALMAQRVEDEKEKRHSEIRALQAQINPHFLYNTLDAIIWMAASGKNDEVMEMTSALARLFRTSISSDHRLVPLSMEKENILSYLTIQKMRYEDKLTYTLDVPERFDAFLLPKLILQPIVENAIYHGLKPLPDGGMVHIHALERGGCLVLSVEDNGVGMDEEQIRRLFIQKPQDSHGIGVVNVHSRIRLLFGEPYGLFYSSRSGCGTRVEILLPMLTEEKEAEG